MKNSIQTLQSGFTLIELMIVVVILSILLAIAVPSYVENGKQGSRSDVKGLLLENAQFMERHATTNNGSYIGTAPTLPINRSPRDAAPGKQKYDIAFDGAPTATTFRIKATPTGGNSMAGDKCGAYTIDNLGRKNAADGAPTGGMTVDSCWNH